MRQGFPEPDRSFFEAVLSGPRLVLRPYSEKRDLDRIAAMLDDPRVTAPMGIPEPKTTREQLREIKEERSLRNDSGDWTAFIPGDGKSTEETFIGEVGIVEWNFETYVAEVFAAITPGQSGKAFGREAVSCLVEHVFRSFPLACIRTQALVPNKKASEMASSLGFREAGRRFVPPNPESGFIGGSARVLDCRAHQFWPFTLNENQEKE